MAPSTVMPATAANRQSSAATAIPPPPATSSAAPFMSPPMAAAAPSSNQLNYGYQLADPALDLLDAANWNFGMQQPSHPQQRQYQNDVSVDAFVSQFETQLQPRSADYLSPNVTVNPMPTDLASEASALDAAYAASAESLSSALAMQMNDCNNELFALDAAVTSSDGMSTNLQSCSPSELLEVRSLSSSDNGWNSVDFPSGQSFDSIQDVASSAGVAPVMTAAATASNQRPNNPLYIDPAQTMSLHIRANSDSSGSDAPLSAYSLGSWEEVPFPLRSPEPDINPERLSTQGNIHQHGTAMSGSPQMNRSYPAHHRQAITPLVMTGNVSAGSISSTTTTAGSSTGTDSSSPILRGSRSPPVRRRKKSPTNSKISKPSVVKKASVSQAVRKEPVAGERRVGRRRGPLQPHQRQQAHEIRKVGACLRCKFLKKTCNKGDPCGGCQPSHARLWQVPCTRIDIKDINFFMKDWKADYERHMNTRSSMANIKGFSALERPLFVTHGYGYYLPIEAREVYVHDEDIFGLDWIEAFTPDLKAFEIRTAKLSAGSKGISSDVLSKYLDCHIDSGFEDFVDKYYGGTIFVTEILKTAHRFYEKEKSDVVRKALKLVVAYNLTLHVTMVKGMSEEESKDGRINDESSQYYGQTMAPVMINFQVKLAMAQMWRQMQKEVLEGLSALYSSVYSGDKLKNWPTIFVLAAILLLVWEQMQFDAQYRVSNSESARSFCNEMENIPVGVVVGLFSAISQKLPAFKEWDTRKHHQLLNSNPAVCEAMTEVRDHVTKHGESCVFG